MVATQHVSVNNSQNKVVLSEKDIPGAALPRDTPEQCTVTQLRRWLLCRGAKTSGKKPELVKRYNDYVKAGLHVKTLRDPDGGIHLARKKAELGMIDEVNPEKVMEKFPKDGFSELKCQEIPVINFGTIWKYMIEAINAKKQLSTAKPLVKGYNFYKSGHVLSVFVCLREHRCFIKSKVLPSMKKSCVYSCYIVHLSNGQVKESYCGCPAGVDGRCNHIAATLFALAEYARQQLRNHQQKTSRTSEPCTWNVPRKRKGDVVPIKALKFQKHDYGKVNTERKSEINTEKDPRAPHQRKCDNTKLYNVLTAVQKLQEKTGQTIGLSHILPIATSSNLAATIYREHDYCKSTENEETVTSASPERSASPETPATDTIPSTEELINKCQHVKRNLFVTQEEAKDIEQKTRGQSANPLWYKHRQQRITSSKCYRCAVLKACTSPTKAVKEVLDYSTFEPTAAMIDGLSKEPEILQEYIKAMIKRGHSGIEVKDSGLIVSPKHCFLATSPDGLVYDPKSNPPEGLIEMKYVQMKEGETLTDALIRKHICVYNQGQVKVNHRHQYFYQTQHQMFVSERKWNDFVVKGTLSPELFIERVEFDQSFWGSVFAKLELFFDKHIIPEIAFEKIKYGLPRLSI